MDDKTVEFERSFSDSIGNQYPLETWRYNSGSLTHTCISYWSMLIYELEITFKVTSSINMDKKPKKGEYLDILLRSLKTIFSTKDAALLWAEERESTVSARLNKYVKAGKLIGVRRGLYAKDKNYDKFELATKIYTPSYISFETVLAKAGVIFQFYGQVFVASYITREVVVDGQIYSYKRIRDQILTNHTGVEAKNSYYIASPERAFLDIVYASKSYHFDNLSPLDWVRIFEILPIYKNKSMEKRVKKYHKSINESK